MLAPPSAVRDLRVFWYPDLFRMERWPGRREPQSAEFPDDTGRAWCRGHWPLSILHGQRPRRSRYDLRATETLKGCWQLSARYVGLDTILDVKIRVRRWLASCLLGSLCTSASWITSRNCSQVNAQTFSQTIRRRWKPCINLRAAGSIRRTTSLDFQCLAFEKDHHAKRGIQIRVPLKLLNSALLSLSVLCNPLEETCPSLHVVIPFSLLV